MRYIFGINCGQRHNKRLRKVLCPKQSIRRYKKLFCEFQNAKCWLFVRDRLWQSQEVGTEIVQIQISFVRFWNFVSLTIFWSPSNSELAVPVAGGAHAIDTALDVVRGRGAGCTEIVGGRPPDVVVPGRVCVVRVCGGCSSAIEWWVGGLKRIEGKRKKGVVHFSCTLLPLCRYGGHHAASPL